jgi:hypothetical protein
MFNMSAAMATAFVAAATEMTELVTELGPNPLRIPRSHETTTTGQDERSQ